MPLEEMLRRGCKRSQSDLFDKYRIMRDYLEENYYPWIQANCPWYTDHGHAHIQSVIQAAGHILNGSADELNCMELYLLLSGIIWHDAGLVYGRSGHQDKVKDMTDTIKALAFQPPAVQRLVAEIAKAHSGPDGLKFPRAVEEIGTSSATYTVRPRSLAALVRFCDEISENQSRISRALMPGVPEEQRPYWEYANSVVASRPDPARGRVVLEISLEADALSRDYQCPEEFQHRGEKGRISLIQYMLCRLEKMNNERAYCAPEFRRFAVIDEIEARFQVIRVGERLKGYDDLTIILGAGGLKGDSYPNIGIYNDFFDMHPQWGPGALREALK